MIVVIVVAVLAVLVVAIAVGVMRLARPVDGVRQFQRQIDALSPEARRPVVDQVNQLDDGEPDTPSDDDGPAADPDGGAPPGGPDRGA